MGRRTRKHRNCFALGGDPEGGVTWLTWGTYGPGWMGDVRAYGMHSHLGDTDRVLGSQIVSTLINTVCYNCVQL